ncbi:hypothetical protein VNO80_21133 [Phaseolus coccineus]|uniref:Uncharacterized protein n=1 Tax=Phaseolus coccineus TaxID=3886 RepID=A0AAN9QQM4_PHACN
MPMKLYCTQSNMKKLDQLKNYQAKTRTVVKNTKNPCLQPVSGQNVTFCLVVVFFQTEKKNIANRKRNCIESRGTQITEFISFQSE